jgi:hypothetical protein
MARALPELAMASILVGCATLACRRWGPRIGGLIGALPAVVGPVLLITAQDRGAAFTARAANGTLLGITALSAFVLAYSRVADRARWGASLAAGWMSAALVAGLVGWWGGGLAFPDGLGVATISLGLAYALMPRSAAAVTGGPLARREVPLRMVLTAALTATLATAAELFGPVIGGMLAALPVLASVLAVFTHRRDGSEAVVALLGGMLSGMTGFVGFCSVVAVLIVPAGAAAAFAAASVTALGLQVLAIVYRPSFE